MVNVIDFKPKNTYKYENIDSVIKYAKSKNIDFAICFKSEDIEGLLEEDTEDCDVTVMTVNMDIVNRMEDVIYVDLNQI